MTLDREITEDCVAIAFYGICDDPASVMQFYHDLICWYNSVGCTPDKMAVVGSGFSGKIIGFEKSHLHLRKKGFATIKSVEAFAMLPNGELPTVHWWATASLSLDYMPHFVLQARRSITTLEDDALGRLIESCVTNLNPNCGIGYPRDHNKGPGFYAIGLNYGNDATRGHAYEEKLTISRWGNIGMKEEVYKLGFLRGVYPHNYLSEQQLSRRVGYKTLHEWISSDSSRGSLTKLNNRMILWKVAFSHIEPIRESLWSAGVIFDWKKHLGE